MLSSAAGTASSVPEVCAPPEERTITTGPSVETVSDEDADASGASVPTPDSSVEGSDEVVDVGPIDDELDPEDVDVEDGSDAEEGEDDDGSDAEEGEGDVGFESEAVELFESEAVELEEAVDEDSSAHATPGVVATAPLTPSATARAPTRPMYLAYAVVIIGLQSPNVSYANLLTMNTGSEQSRKNS